MTWLDLTWLLFQTHKTFFLPWNTKSNLTIRSFKLQKCFIKEVIRSIWFVHYILSLLKPYKSFCKKQKLNLSLKSWNWPLSSVISIKADTHLGEHTLEEDSKFIKGCGYLAGCVVLSCYWSGKCKEECGSYSALFVYYEVLVDMVQILLATPTLAVLSKHIWHHNYRFTTVCGSFLTLWRSFTFIITQVADSWYHL